MNANMKRMPVAGLLAALSLLLTGCLITPGKFNSTLVLNDDRSFSFAYSGEIFMMALHPEVMGKGGPEDAPPAYCYDDSSGSTRQCTPEEEAQQATEWAEAQSRRQARDQEEMAKFASLIGDIDPSDPEAGNKIAAMLMRQKGWRDVRYKGEGMFEVDYAISGLLSHDLTFPVMENISTSTPFFQFVLRADDTVRIDAPAFVTADGGGSMMGLMIAEMAGTGSKAGNGDLPFPKAEGTFRIVTNGRILTNNTDKGPTMQDGRQTLEWDMAQMGTASPTALIQMAN
ncbi:MAG: hypothetical protein WA908_08335 [Pontixanthobacter sp.]